MENKKKHKEAKPLYVTLPTANGDFVSAETGVKIPKDSDVEDLKDFSSEHKL